MTEVASLPRRLFAEVLGTALLLAVIVGSGIMAQRLSPTDVGVELLESVLAIGFVLFALIVTLGPVSGAHFNPIITLADAWFGGTDRRDIAPYLVAQVVGACLGTMLANLMFGLAAVQVSSHVRDGSGMLLSEVVATFGLLMVVFGLVRSNRSQWVGAAVASYIVGACWFTQSTSFANPAVAVARTLTDTFAGIAPQSVPAFVLGECAGAVLGVIAVLVLWPTPSSERGVAIDVHREAR